MIQELINFNKSPKIIKSELVYRFRSDAIDIFVSGVQSIETDKMFEM